MTKLVEAVYESGLLRPLQPLALREHQQVTVIITESQPSVVRSHLDIEYRDALKKEVADMDRIITIEEVHKITSRDSASWADAILAEREE